MPEYIEREALLAELEDEIDFVSPFYNAEQNQYFTMGLQCAYRDAQRFPAAADVVEVVRGRWIKRQFADEPTAFGYSCSECHLTYEVDTNYCPNCGAKMDGKEVE